MHLRFLITLLVTCGSLSFSQGYYPLQVGNQWDYGEITSTRLDSITTCILSIFLAIP
jgi:hypothetical protein